MQDTCIQIGLVESNTFNRETMVYTLTSQPDFQVTFAVSSVNEVPRSDASPNVMLFSAWYPSEIFGADLSIDYWRVRLPHTRLVLLTSNKMRAIIEILQNQGIEGYAIRQTLSTDALFDIVRCVARGEPVVCQTTRNILAASKTEKDLTRREVEIIHLLHQVGIGNRKQVAHLLGVSTLTINQHLKNIFVKLEVGGVADVMERGRVIGLIPSETAA